MSCALLWSASPFGLLAPLRSGTNLRLMIPGELSRSALDLSPEERLELARQLVESVVRPEQVVEAVEEGVQRIEEIAHGKVQGLSEEQYRASLQ